MEKQTIIRSAAIVAAGIAASVTGAHYLLDGRSDTRRAAAVEEPLAPQVQNVSLLSGAATAEIDATDTTLPADATFLALSDPDSAFTDDMAPQLTVADMGGSAAPAEHCDPQLEARDMIDALIELSVTAPCHANERLVVSHGDLVFSAYTDESGNFSTYLPALSERARLDVFVGDSVFLQTELHMPEATAHHRVVLQWTGLAGFGLHAFHRSAVFGGAGHLHALQPFDPMQEETFLISLGEPRGPEPMLAQIYSVPVELVQDSRIELELQFDAKHCGQELSAFILQSGAGIASGIKEASFATPPCPSADGFLVMELPILAPQHAQIHAGAALLLQDLSE